MSLYEVWPKYPAVLTAKGWDKHKGIIAKVVKGETGVSAALNAAEAAYKDVVAARFSETTVDTSTRASCDLAVNHANAEFAGPLKALCDQLLKFKKLAETKAELFQKSNVVPKSSRLYLEQIADGAQDFTDKMRHHCITAIADIKAEKAKATS